MRSTHRILYPLIVLAMALVMAAARETLVVVVSGLVIAGAVAGFVVAERRERQGRDPAI
ncbi:MAG: hypothetical protein JJT89_09510 [Nitriliruptoraceae bacterium]|nr:hypothetical protein [Nitriliruptoraceae bacterium]